MKILAKITSRERPEQLKNCIKTLLEKAHRPEDIIISLSIDSDDALTINSLHELQEIKHLNIDVAPRTTKIGAINRGVLSDGWDVLVNVSDDQLASMNGWDDVIRFNVALDKDLSLWFHDGIQPRINTMEIVGRAYYERFGYIYHPEYKSFFCDNEATEVALMLGKMVRHKDLILFKHHHRQSNQKLDKVDNLHQVNDSYWKHDEDLFYSRQKINFGL